MILYTKKKKQPFDNPPNHHYRPKTLPRNPPQNLPHLQPPDNQPLKLPRPSSIKLILAAECYALVRGKMGHLREAATQANVSKLILNLSPHAEMTPGIASYITELLFRNGVNILDAFLGYGDIIMVVDDKDGPLAYDVLQREIQGSNPP